MAGRPRANIEQYLTNIQPYLEVGCSLYEACLHGCVPYTTVIDYQKNDDEIRKKIERMSNVPILTARQSVVGSMAENAELALKYLERKKKDEFSLKTEVDSNVKGNISISIGLPSNEHNNTISATSENGEV